VFPVSILETVDELSQNLVMYFMPSEYDKCSQSHDSVAIFIICFPLPKVLVGYGDDV
jgi:hypothetical protein